MSFVHLHCHSQYSLLDGVARISKKEKKEEQEEAEQAEPSGSEGADSEQAVDEKAEEKAAEPDGIVETAARMGMKAVALTDHGNVYGLVQFYRAAKKHEIKPILGCELYLDSGSRFDRPNHKELNLEHLVLLVKDETGYRNLCKLITLSYLEGFYYKPRIDLQALAAHKDGLIALSACLSGVVAKSLNQGDWQKAKEKALALKEIMGEDHFYLEIQDQGLPEQAGVNEQLRKLAKETGLPLVATNDVHYIKQEDHRTQELLLCIQTNSSVADPDRKMKFHGDQFYFKSEEEMREVFPHDEEAINNSGLIADRCDFDLELERILLPEFDVPEGYTLQQLLREKCLQGMESRYAPEQREKALTRMEKELGIIDEMGFAGYFLIVGDFVGYAKDNGIRVGPGRGSAAGSVVSYLMGITDIEPLHYGLLFERFLNPSRRSMPDIDIDFDDERRGEVIAYVSQKYGQDRVAQIITFSRMAARSATRDAGRVLGYSYAVVDKIAKKIPAVPGKNYTIEDALKASDELREEYENNEEARIILDAASPLVGSVRQDSIHAAGIVIAPGSLTDYVPLQRKGEAEVLTQFEMKDIEKIGLLKMDFLGLRTLTVISDALGLIKQSEGTDIDLAKLDMNDKNTFNLLQQGHTFGVFQLESSGMRDLLQSFRPESVEDITAIVAMYRPGPMELIPQLIERKHGRKKVAYADPSLESILQETYGIMVYQEQVMQVAVQYAGFSMAEADNLRKGMGKKNKEVFKEQRENFVRGAEQKGHTPKKANEIFDLIEKFAGYGFNKSHAAAYAVVAYQTAYLKANYTVEFMAALLSSVKDDQDKIASYIHECRRMRIPVLSPDVNESDVKFAVAVQDGKKGIRFGLSAIRNIGGAAIEAIISSRQSGRYKDFHDFCARVGPGNINRKTLESLIMAGAFDSFGVNRRSLMLGYEKVLEETALGQKERESGQFNLFGDEDFPATPLAEAEEFSRDEKMAGEKEMLGLYVTDHPLRGKESLLALNQDCEIAALHEMEDGSQVSLAGLINKVIRKTTKKGDMMSFIQLEDLSGSIEVIAFPAVAERASESIAEDHIISVKGRLDVREREESKEVKLIAMDIKLLRGKHADNSGKDGNGARKDMALRLRLSSKQDLAGISTKLREILEDHPGEVPVFVELTADSGGTLLMRLGERFSVELDHDLIASIKELMPRESVQIESNGKMSGTS